ncbi:MAG TPA: hypothetical protein ENK67_05370 [Flavobacteriia bacterium]|nr:hypothetical protein [Flavobacteriia bacterium]
MSEFYNLKVIDKQQLTPESVSLTLEIPQNLKEIFKFKPGQFVIVEKDLNGETLKRYYSIYNSPDEPNLIKLGIKLKGADGFADFAMHQLKPGEILRVSAPMNDVAFDLSPEKAQKILGITIGSGITPFYSFIQYMVKHLPNAKMVLIYGNETLEKTMFYNKLHQIAKQYPQQLKIYEAFSKDNNHGDFQHRINESVVKKVLEKEDTDFDAVYIVGPDDLKKMAGKVLKEAGITDDKLHYRVYS